MYNLFERTIERIGPNNVVQVVTDNASENVKAGSMMMGAYPHIYGTPCTAHCINLMFGDIFKIKPYSTVFKKAVRIHSYISQRPLLLNLMRKFTNERNLVKPAKTRFATAFLTLKATYKQQKNLRTLILSNEWTSSRFAKETLGKEVASHLLARWTDQLHRPLHATGYILNPGLFYDAQDKGTIHFSVWKEYHTCVEKMNPELAIQDLLVAELPKYKMADGLFGCGQAQRAKDTRSPVEWWSLFGSQTPTLQKFAMKVLSLTCSSSGCERNWSVFEHIHSKKRSRLALSRLNDLVYIKYNRTLKRRYNARDVIDAISLDFIDESNEWLVGCPEDQEEELVYEEGDLTWGTVATAIGVDESIYDLRGVPSRASARDKGKGVATTSTSSSRTHALRDEESEEEEDEEQYNDNEMDDEEDFVNLEEE